VVLLLGVIAVGVWYTATHFLAEHHLKRAQQDLARQRYPQALEELNKALRYRPRSTDLHLLAARVARQVGNYPLAREHLRICRKLVGGETPEQQLEHLMVRAQSGELDTVFPQLWPYIEQDRPEAPLVLEALTLAYTTLTMTSHAERCINRWLELEPDNVQALFWRGWWGSTNGNNTLARDSFVRALELDPERNDIRIRLGMTYLDRQEEREALKQFTRVLGDDPEQDEALFGLAKAHRGLGEVTPARKYLEQYLRQHPDDADALTELGGVALDEGRGEEARTCYERVLKDNPAHYRALYGLSLCLRRLGRKAEADALKKRVDASGADIRRVQEIMNQELRRNPTNAELHYELGMLNLRHGKEVDALFSFANALKHDPTHQGAHKALAEYYDKKGDKDQAKKHRDQLKPAGIRP
jgi:Tfp pilus assembly protein PilF